MPRKKNRRKEIQKKCRANQDKQKPHLTAVIAHHGSSKVAALALLAAATFKRE